VAVYSNLSSDKLTSYIQTQHLKRKKKRRKNKKKRKEKKQFSSLALDFEVSPQKKGNTPF